MDLQILAQNIRRLRTSKHLSQKALAEAAGLSLPAIKNLELAKNEPRVNTIQAVAQALSVPLQNLFLPVRELKTVRFRSGKRMQNRGNILAEVSRWLDDFNYLENILNDYRPFKLEHVCDRCSPEDPVVAAKICRDHLHLNLREPIHDICGLLEKAGIKIDVVSNASKALEDFFGLSIGKEDGGPAIVVNVWERITVERRIFSAAHELGHLMMHPDAYDASITEENRGEEQQADRFAGHFLMPDEGFLKEWDYAAGLHWVDRVFKVKRIFRVSYKTVLKRLLEKELVSDNIWAKFHIAYKQRFRRSLGFRDEPLSMEESVEPFRLQQFDFFEDRLSLLTKKAVGEDKISLSRGAEILGIGIEEMQDRLKNWGGIILEEENRR